MERFEGTADQDEVPREDFTLGVDSAGNLKYLKPNKYNVKGSEYNIIFYISKHLKGRSGTALVTFF